MANKDIKIIAAILTVVGAILSILDRLFSPGYPEALRIIGWLFLLVPPLIYILIDLPNLFSRKD